MEWVGSLVSWFVNRYKNIKAHIPQQRRKTVEAGRCICDDDIKQLQSSRESHHRLKDKTVHVRRLNCYVKFIQGTVQVTHLFRSAKVCRTHPSHSIYPQ
jgi:hypothetical protein